MRWCERLGWLLCAVEFGRYLEARRQRLEAEAEAEREWERARALLRTAAGR